MCGQVGGRDPREEDREVAELAEEMFNGRRESGIRVLCQQRAGQGEETVPQLLELGQSPAGDEAQRDFPGHVL